MRKKPKLEAVPALVPPAPAPPDPKPKIKVCPPTAMKVIQEQIGRIKKEQIQLQVLVNTVAATLGIDHEKEKWDFNADVGVFTKASRSP